MRIALTVAGSASGGRAGIQADLKTFHQFGVHGTSAIVALTAQNTQEVRAVHPVPPEFIRHQLEVLADDLPPNALKTGMLGDSATVAVVVDTIREHSWAPLVVDPVMVSSSGARLLDAAAEARVRDELLPLAALVTPNLDEAEVLTGFEVRSPEAMERAGRALLELGAGAALVKGGHLTGDQLTDVLVTPDHIRRFDRPRLATRSTHGTGCTLSAAVTAGLALGHSLETSVEDALTFVARAIADAPGLGGGHGPVNHAVKVGSGEWEVGSGR